MTYLQRKKLAFINMVNKVKGFIRTVSGVPPLALTDCVDEDSLINYSISGNDTGDLTNNLFNPDWLEQGTLYDHNGATSNSTTRVRTKFVELTSGTYYIGVNAGILRGLHIYDYDTEAHESYTNWSCAAHKIFTLDKRSKVRFIFNYVTNATMTPEDVLSKQPRLVLSDVEVPYEPYGKYKIPIVCSNATGNSVLTNLYLDKPLTKGETIDYEKDNLPKLPTIKGTTIYTVDTTIQPSDMSVTYYSTSKE